jgi:hypothetical protein
MDDELKKEVRAAYQLGKVSIQDIARIKRLTVDEVLEIIGEGELKSVQTGGDLIDPSEAGPGASMNYGRDFKVPFTTD